MTPANQIRLAYTAGFGVYGSVLPFLPLMLREQGLSDSEIGLAYIGFGVAASFSPMILAHFADRRSNPRAHMAGMLAATALVIPLWQLCHTPSAAFVVTLFAFALLVPVLALLDSYTLRFLEEASSPDDPPSTLQAFRVWGSIGFIIPSLALTLLQLIISIEGIVFTAVGSAFAFWGCLSALRLPRLNRPPEVKKLPSLDAVRLAFRRPLRPLFLSWFVGGIGLAMFYLILPRYLQELGCDAVQIGLITNLGVLAEVILIYVSGVMPAKFYERMLFTAGWGALLLRLCLMAFFPKLPLTVATQILHGPMVLGLFVAAPILLARSAGAAVKFSLQGLYTTVTLGITRILGAGVFALTMSMVTRQGVYAQQLAAGIAAATVLAGLVIMFIDTRSETGSKEVRD